MTTLRWRPVDSSAGVEVDDENPLPTRAYGPVQVGASGDSGYCGVPGIVTGAAYADGDAIGAGAIVFPNCLRSGVQSGQLYSATYLDLDDEGLQVDLHLYAAVPTYAPTDNGAYAPSDADLVNSRYIGTVSFATFSNFSSNQVSVGSFNPIGVAGAPGTNIYGHVVARGALNIAIGNLPLFRLLWLSD